MLHLCFTSPLLAVLACATDGPEDGSETDSNVIMNACGTYDLNEPGDSNIPQDPDDPVILAACTSKCEAMAQIEGCADDLEACVETCKFRSCDVCSDTLAPLVQCEAEQIDPSVCTCENGVVQCPATDACDAQNDATYQCGG